MAKSIQERLTSLERKIKGICCAVANTPEVVPQTETFDIIADGTLGGPYNLNFQYNSYIPSTSINGLMSFPINISTSFYIDGQNFVFTAINLEFPTIKSMGGLGFNNCSTLEVLSLPLLETITGDLNLTSNQNLNTVNFPSLKTVLYGISFGDSLNLSTINFPVLESAYFNIFDNCPFSTIDAALFPSLKRFGLFLQGSNISNFEVDLPLVTSLTGASPGYGGLTKLLLPGLVDNNNSYVDIAYRNEFKEVVLGTVGTLKSFGSPSQNVSIQFQGCALSQDSVDNLLLTFATLDGTNGTTIASNGQLFLSGGMNAIPSSFTVNAVNELLNRGWYISIN